MLSDSAVYALYMIYFQVQIPDNQATKVIGSLPTEPQPYETQDNMLFKKTSGDSQYEEPSKAISNTLNRMHMTVKDIQGTESVISKHTRFNAETVSSQYHSDIKIVLVISTLKVLALVCYTLAVSPLMR